MDREYKSRIERLFAEYGVTDYSFQFGGKHPLVIASAGANSIRYRFPTSGSDKRGVLNCLADIKRQLGLRLKTKSGRPPKKARAKQSVRFLTANGQSQIFDSLSQAGEYLLAHSIIARSLI